MEKRYQLKKKKCCSKCGAETKLTLDHVVPVSKGGHPTSKKNLDILCEYCNKDKGSKLRKGAIVIGGLDYNFILDKLKNSIHLRIDEMCNSKKRWTFINQI